MLYVSISFKDSYRLLLHVHARQIKTHRLGSRYQNNIKGETKRTV